MTEHESDNSHGRDFGPPDVCELIIRRLEGTTPSQWQGGIIYTYPSSPGDAALTPPPDNTTILIASGDRARWFDIDVREIDPADPAQAYRLDPDMLISLARRAGLPSLRSW